MVNDKKQPPFGTKAKRFLSLGYHPSLEVRPGTFRHSEIYPGCYETNKSQKIVSQVPRWKRQMEMEEFSRRMGYDGDCILKQEKWLKSINGPGWQDVPSGINKQVVSFPKATRFPTPKFKAHSVPGPGTYGKNHVPHTRKEEKSRGKGFSFSTLPSFEQTSHLPRSLSTQKPYHLPPNLYELKSFTDVLVSKRTSKRGPYDLFTGDRFSDPIVMTKSSTLSQIIHSPDLNHPKNAFKGVFLRCGKDSILTSRLILMDLALAKKNPLDPGPNFYDPYPTPAVTQARATFNSSVQEARPVIKCELTAPPGRYNLEIKNRILGDGMRSAFLSKVKRDLPQPEKLSWFE